MVKQIYGLMLLFRALGRYFFLAPLLASVSVAWMISQKPLAGHTNMHWRDKWMARGTGAKLGMIYASSIQPALAQVSSSSGCELLCSYNWVDQNEATIFVPGIQVPLCTLQLTRHCVIF